MVMRGKLKKRFISILLVITLLFSVLPFSAITASAATYKGITIGTYTSMTKATFESKIANYNYVLLFYQAENTTYTEAHFKNCYTWAKAKGKGVGVVLTAKSVTQTVFDMLKSNSYKFDYPIYLRYSSTKTATDADLTKFEGLCKSNNFYGGIYGGSTTICNKYKTSATDALYTAYYGYGTNTAYHMYSTCGSTWPAIGTFPTSQTTKNFLTDIKAKGLNGYSSSSGGGSETPTVPDTPSTDSGNSFYAYVNVHGHTNYQNNTFKSLSVEDESSNTSNVRAEAPDYQKTKQIWYFEYAGAANTYYIKNLKTGGYLCAEKKPAQRVNVCTAETYKSDDSNFTKWKLDSPVGSATYTSESYTIKPASNTNFYLHIYRKAPDVTGHSLYDAVLSNTTTGSDTDGIWYTTDKDFLIEKIQTVDNGVEARIQNTTYNSETRLTEDNSSLTFSSTMSSSDNDYDKQFWRFVRTADNSYPPTYNIINKQTGNALAHYDSSGATSHNGIQAAEYNTDSDAQKWILLSKYDGNVSSVKIVPYCCSSNVHAYYRDDTYTPIAEVIPCLSAAATAEVKYDDRSGLKYFNLEFPRQPVDLGDFYTAVKPNGNNGFALSAGVDSTGAVMRSVTDTPSVDQQWYFKSLGDNKYKIENLATGTALTATSNGAELAEYADDNNHKWFIIKEANGYSIVNAADTSYNSKYLNLAAIAANESTLSFANSGTTT